MKFNTDKFFTVASVVYVTLPVILFFTGWLNVYISVPAVLICVYFADCLYSELFHESCKLIDRLSAKFWFITFAVLCIWVMLSGIGNFSHQNWDFIARNPIYRDLCSYNWPVIYDFSEQTPYVQSIIGSGKAAFSYYFSWWLPPALACKIFSFGQTGQNVCIYMWALLGVFLITYNLCRYLRRNSFAIVVIFIFFSGLDVVGYVAKNFSGAGVFPDIMYRHIEWWAGTFQMSSNTSLLFWVFNQSIPTWLITCLLLQLRSSQNFMALSSFIFAYSAWAVFGIIPLAIFVLFESRDSFRKAFTLQNIAVPLLMMILYGAFYASSTGAENASKFNIHDLKSAANYLSMIFLEVLVFLFIMGKTATNYRFYYVAAAELILIPLYDLLNINFCIRAVIPPLFLLMTFVIKFLTEGNNPSLRIQKIFLVATLSIGALTAFSEINRSIGHHILLLMKDNEITAPIVSRLPRSFVENPLLREDVYSMGRIRTNDKIMIETLARQFFIYDYEHTIFFKYFAKKAE